MYVYRCAHNYDRFDARYIGISEFFCFKLIKYCTPKYMSLKYSRILFSMYFFFEKYLCVLSLSITLTPNYKYICVGPFGFAFTSRFFFCYISYSFALRVPLLFLDLPIAVLDGFIIHLMWYTIDKSFSFVSSLHLVRPHCSSKMDILSSVLTFHYIFLK